MVVGGVCVGIDELFCVLLLMSSVVGCDFCFCI